jgi:hypothetical protein
MLRKIVAMTLMLAFLFAMIPAPAAAFSQSCERYRTCNTTFSCAWWGADCAMTSLNEFFAINGPWY